MITARRSDDSVGALYEQRNMKNGVDLLERKVPASYDEFVGNTPEKEKLEDAKARMRRNLDLLLNSNSFEEIEREKASASAASAVITEEKPVAETVGTSASATQTVSEKPTALSDDDIKPTSTTLQFGDGDIEKIYSDIERSKEESKNSFKLNAKGKLVVFLYALAVTVILALIILNTGVLAVLKNNNVALKDNVAKLNSQYSAIADEINSVSGDAYVSEIAENELNMVKK